MLVNMPMVGLMTGAMRCISPGRLMPASKMAACVWLLRFHTLSGTPVCELYERGERVTFMEGVRSWLSHSFTIVLPLLPVMPMTGMSGNWLRWWAASC